MTEHDLQASIIAECNFRANQNDLYGRIFAVPNGGHRDIRVAQRLKAEGVRPGVPDLLLLAPRRGYNGLAIELKVGRNHATASQEDWLLWLRTEGYMTRVVYDSADEAMTIISWYIEGIDA